MGLNSDSNSAMQVLEHSPFKLVILDGEMGFGLGTPPTAENLFIAPLILLGICGTVTFWFTGSIRQALINGLLIAAVPFIGILLIRIYGGGRLSTYTFDKRSHTLTCSTPAIFPYRAPKLRTYSLNDIIAVESVTDTNDEPPPLYWRSIHLKMSTKTLKLYPGHEKEKLQETMYKLIRDFLEMSPL